jgi:hypothetical protein
LRDADGREHLVAGDVEPEVRGERLELLAVVRALEALEHPARITLMTPSVYVREGIRYGLSQWRSDSWCWEFFGTMVPIKNGDLWRRVDRAMQFHQIECLTWRIDRSHARGAPGSGIAAGWHRRQAVALGRWRQRFALLVAASRRRVVAGWRELSRAACV